MYYLNPKEAGLRSRSLPSMLYALHYPIDYVLGEGWQKESVMEGMLVLAIASPLWSPVMLLGTSVYAQMQNLILHMEVTL
jgi:hypothetical protein